MDNEPDVISIRLTQQQIEVLERLKGDGQLGSDYSEILLNASRSGSRSSRSRFWRDLKAMGSLALTTQKSC